MKSHSYLLVRHPAVLDRLRNEIRLVASHEEGLTRAEILKMPYLKCILNESWQPLFQILLPVLIASSSPALSTATSQCTRRDENHTLTPRWRSG